MMPLSDTVSFREMINPFSAITDEKVRVSSISVEDVRLFPVTIHGKASNMHVVAIKIFLKNINSVFTAPDPGHRQLIAWQVF